MVAMRVRPIAENQFVPRILQETDMVVRHRSALLAGYMVLDGMSIADIHFLIRVYALFARRGLVNCSEMAREINCSRQTAARHVGVLTKKGYLTRKHYRAWSLNNDYITKLSSGSQKEQSNGATPH